jgi:hypothetical protein
MIDIKSYYLNCVFWVYLSSVVVKLVIFSPCFSISLKYLGIESFGLVVGVSSTIDTIGVFSPVILPCASVRGPGVSNLLARFTFSPLFGKYETLHLVQNHSSFCASNSVRLQLHRLQNSFEFGGYETEESFILMATKSLLLFGGCSEDIG